MSDGNRESVREAGGAGNDSTRAYGDGEGEGSGGGGGNDGGGSDEKAIRSLKEQRSSRGDDPFGGPVDFVIPFDTPEKPIKPIVMSKEALGGGGFGGGGDDGLIKQKRRVAFASDTVQPAPAAPTPPPPPPPTPTPRIMVNAYVVCDSIYWAQKLFGAGMFTLLATWIFGYAGGIGFQNEPKLEFNIHPLLMSACMVFLNGEAITIYRGNRFRAKSVTKSLHALIQTIVAVFASLGLKAAWDSHNYNKPQPIPNLYSFHSWLGIATFSIFCVQLVGGIGTYLLPYASLSMRKQMMPFHRSSGFLIFILSLSSALLGYSEKSAWAFTCWTKDGVLCGMVIVAHLYAACLVLYALCVILVLLNPDWIRKPLPSEISPSQQRLNPENDHLQPVLGLQH